MKIIMTKPTIHDSACRAFSVSLFGMFLLCCVSLRQPISAIGAEIETNQQKASRAIAKWQEMFGPIDLSKNDMFNCLISVHPQPKSAFLSFRVEQLSPGIVDHHQNWLVKHFKGPFFTALSNLPPSKYYMNEGRVEPSLLLYELEFSGNSVCIIESYQGFLLWIKPPDFDASVGIAPQFVGQVLFEWINLKKPAWGESNAPGANLTVIGQGLQVDPDRSFWEEDMENWYRPTPDRFTVPYASIDEILRTFKLPQRLKMGDVFTNRTRTIVASTRSWHEYVIGFVVKDGLCLLIDKSVERTDMDFSYDYNWLNKGLFQADGKTLVDPPKNQRSNDPDRVGEPTTPRK